MQKLIECALLYLLMGLIVVIEDILYRRIDPDNPTDDDLESIVYKMFAWPKYLLDVRR